MTSYFDIFSVALFIATASIFFFRFQYENPKLHPYLVISVSCAVANWLGDNQMQIAAIVILAAGAFLLLHLTSMPYDQESMPD